MSNKHHETLIAARIPAGLHAVALTIASVTIAGVFAIFFNAAAGIVA